MQDLCHRKRLEVDWPLKWNVPSVIEVGLVSHRMQLFRWLYPGSLQWVTKINPVCQETRLFNSFIEGKLILQSLCGWCCCFCFNTYSASQRVSQLWLSLRQILPVAWLLFLTKFGLRIQVQATVFELTTPTLEAVSSNHWAVHHPVLVRECRVKSKIARLSSWFALPLDSQEHSSTIPQLIQPVP